MERKRVFLAEGQPQVRSALRLLLDHEPEITVVDEAASGRELLTQAPATRADLFLVAWDLPGLTPLSIRQLRALCPQGRIVALSGRPEARDRALGAGVDVFVSKGEPPDVLLAAQRVLPAPREQ